MCMCVHVRVSVSGHVHVCVSVSMSECVCLSSVGPLSSMYVYMCCNCMFTCMKSDKSYNV